MSDVRARLTGRFLDDALILTAGVNAPSGATGLTGEQLEALRELARTDRLLVQDSEIDGILRLDMNGPGANYDRFAAR